MSGAGEAEAVLRRSGVLGADCGATAGAGSGAPVLRGPATLPVVPAPISGSDTGPAPHLA